MSAEPLAGAAVARKRVLFVDDEPLILEGLRNTLRRQRHQWDMAFVTSGQQALLLLAAQPFDVVVSDLRMPGMDGATLLAQVQASHPAVARIVLSGHADLEMSLRAAPVAHQYLAKPCTAEVLVQAIARACELQSLLGDDKLRALVSGASSLPAQPRVFAALTQVLGKPDASMAEVAAVVEEDLAISASVLKLVNSAFFGVPRPVTTVARAVSYLGTKLLQSLVLFMEVLSAPQAEAGAGGLSVRALHRHAFLTARLAKELRRGESHADEAAMAAMLHDVGKLVLVTHHFEALAALQAQAVAEQRPLYRLEHDQLGYCHAEVGGFLLGLWGLPFPVVEAVVHHHDPARAQPLTHDLVATLHVADALANEAVGGALEAARVEHLDRATLQTCGIDGKLDAWRALALRIAADEKGSHG